MAGLVIVSGPCGKGQGSYESEVFALPDGSRRSIDTVGAIEVHSGLAGGGRDGWADDVLRGLKGGLALASNLELSGTLGLAAGAIGAGLNVVGGGKADQARALAEISFVDGATILALLDPALPPLLLHDRDVVRRTIARVAAGDDLQAPLSNERNLLLEARHAAEEALGTVSNAAESVVTSAFGLFRRSRSPTGE